MADTSTRAHDNVNGNSCEGGAGCDTSRVLQDTSRQPRCPSRATLQPSVQDFNGNIIKKAMDEDQVMWMVGRSHSKFLPSTDYGYPVPATFRGNGAFAAIHWDRLPYASASAAASLRHDRTSAWTEEVHRRHVARTARARARLSPKQRVTERVIPSTPSHVYDNGEGGAFSLSLPPNVGGDSHLEDLRLTSLSRTSSRADSTPLAMRMRPSTTGRYFDTSNGLRNLRSNPVILRSRPTTATQWSGPGLKVKKLTLHHKELMSM